MALFGALVAVGLGPALWLGVQIGDVPVTPPKAPVVQSEQKPGAGDTHGGAGAAAEDPEPEQAPERKPKAEYLPMTSEPEPKRNPKAEKPAEPVEQPEETTDPTPAPTPTEDDETTAPPEEEDTTAPAEDTTEPAAGPTEG
ncbi:hypothetical protein Acsp02_39670 [Actinoplanes sp. NBRC 103695]|nr:hypothetical protein Acsp02_39670 [Actinoplanes sp. NBRC 103695]